MPPFAAGASLIGQQEAAPRGLKEAVVGFFLLFFFYLSASVCFSFKNKYIFPSLSSSSCGQTAV